MVVRAEITTVPTGSVVVGIDGSDQAEVAMRWAAAEARAQRRELTLVHAMRLPSPARLGEAAVYYEQILTDSRAAGRRLLATAREVVADLVPEVGLREVLVEGDPRDVLLDLSDRAALVVLGSRGRGPVKTLLLGSVGVALVRHARCPVAVLRPGATGGPGGVVVGVDGTTQSTPVLEHAFEAASRRGLPLRVVHCRWLGPLGDSVEEQQLRLAEVVAGMGEKYPDVAVTRETVEGQPDQVLVEAGRSASLTVIGSHSGGVASEILTGSVATSVVEHATGVVVVVPVGDH